MHLSKSYDSYFHTLETFSHFLQQELTVLWYHFQIKDYVSRRGWEGLDTHKLYGAKSESTVLTKHYFLCRHRLDNKGSVVRVFSGAREQYSVKKHGVYRSIMKRRRPVGISYVRYIHPSVQPSTIRQRTSNSKLLSTGLGHIYVQDIVE